MHSLFSAAGPARKNSGCRIPDVPSKKDWGFQENGPNIEKAENLEKRPSGQPFGGCRKLPSRKVKTYVFVWLWLLLGKKLQKRSENALFLAITNLKHPNAEIAFIKSQNKKSTA
jgi:hypothetical protein